jgi:hypothetical protein
VCLPVARLVSNGHATRGLEVLYSQVSIDAQKSLCIAQKSTEKQTPLVTKKTIFVLPCHTFDLSFFVPREASSLYPHEISLDNGWSRST